MSVGRKYTDEALLWALDELHARAAAGTTEAQYRLYTQARGFIIDELRRRAESLFVAQYRQEQVASGRRYQGAMIRFEGIRLFRSTVWKEPR